MQQILKLTPLRRKRAPLSLTLSLSLSPLLCACRPCRSALSVSNCKTLVSNFRFRYPTRRQSCRRLFLPLLLRATRLLSPYAAGNIILATLTCLRCATYAQQFIPDTPTHTHTPNSVVTSGVHLQLNSFCSSL